jgi:hypothetical protein
MIKHIGFTGPIIKARFATAPDFTRFQCIVCGKLTAGRISREGRLTGDTTHRFPRRHRIGGKRTGKPCPGNILEAEWVNTKKGVSYA